ncbi:hypothetical protein Trydic_g8846 [Trypoxylus dichotomus]
MSRSMHPKLCKDHLQHLVADRSIVMYWPSQGADLNPTELLWEEFDWEVRKAVPTSEADMRKKLQEAWVQLIPDTLIKIIARMLRLSAVTIKTKKGRIDKSQV